jgi:hypothetical protein
VRVAAPIRTVQPVTRSRQIASGKVAVGGESYANVRRSNHARSLPRLQRMDGSP